MTWSSAVVFLDEWDCIWWWISKAYVQWLINNAPYLYVLYFTLGPSYVIGYAMSAFLINGYLRVGSATFYDAVGAGNP